MNKESNKGVLLDAKYEDFDIKLIFQTLIRRKILIIIIALLSTTYSFIDALTTPRKYQGEFQVALKTDKDSTSSLLIKYCKLTSRVISKGSLSKSLFLSSLSKYFSMPEIP